MYATLPYDKWTKQRFHAHPQTRGYGHRKKMDHHDKISFNEEAVEKERKKKACLERGPPWCHRVLNERKELHDPWFVLGNSDGDPELEGGGF